MFLGVVKIAHVSERKAYFVILFDKKRSTLVYRYKIFISVTISFYTAKLSTYTVRVAISE